jgi:hypothetical protein
VTTLIIDVRTADGARTFELLVSFEDRLVVAETCIEIFGDRREWRDARSVLLAVGRKPGSPGEQS